jgi:hypothetical protein
VTVIAGGRSVGRRPPCHRERGRSCLPARSSAVPPVDTLSDRGGEVPGSRKPRGSRPAFVLPPGIGALAVVPEATAALRGLTSAEGPHLGPARATHRVSCSADSAFTTSTTAETNRSADPLPRAPGLTHMDTSSHSRQGLSPSLSGRATTPTKPTGSSPRQAMKLGALARRPHSASSKASSRPTVEPNAPGASASAASRTARRVTQSPGCARCTRRSATSPQIPSTLPGNALILTAGAGASAGGGR